MLAQEKDGCEWIEQTAHIPQTRSRLISRSLFLHPRKPLTQLDGLPHNSRAEQREPRVTDTRLPDRVEDVRHVQRWPPVLVQDVGANLARVGLHVWVIDARHELHLHHVSPPEPQPPTPPPPKRPQKNGVET